MSDRPPAPAAGNTGYSVRESPRARRVTLRMSVERGLEVVVPRGFDRAQVAPLVEAKSAWIARVERRMAVERACLAAEASGGLPERVELPAIGEVWEVEYRETASRSVTARERARPVGVDGAGDEPDRPVGGGVAGSAGGGPDRSAGGAAGPNGDRAAPRAATGVLRVSGAVGDPAACRAALRRWLARKAGERLAALLATVAGEEQLSFSSVSVRGQRTRWGSCSRRGVISLNRHLLFLPPELARYVLVHELCHTVKPDHSRRFWAEVRRREPEVELRRKELRAAGRFVPGWARTPRG